MTNKTFQGRIVQKHDTEANWKKATNFVPLKGELIIYDDLNKIKIGDGTTKVNDLKFDTATFYVNVTQGTGNFATADKTAQEVYDAYQAGYAVSAIAKFNGANFPYILPLAGVQSDDDGYILGFGALGSTRADASPQYPTVINLYGIWQMWIGNLVRNEDLATVAKTGSYNDLIDKPTIPSISGLATETYVNTKVAGIVNSAPETLDTLQELASALGNDPNFATTVATEIGKKANSADLATVAKTGDYSDLKGKRTVNGSTNNIETNFYVNFTQKNTTGLDSFQYTADKTIEEIKNAYNHGYNIVGKIANASSMGDLNLPLAIINPTENIFYFMGFGDTSGENAGSGIGLCYIVYDNGSWGGVGYTLALYSDLPDLATVATSGSYSDLINKRTVNGSIENVKTTFYVKFTMDYMADGTYKVMSNKTIDEIKNAYNNGYTIIGFTPNGNNQYNLTLSLYQVNIEKSLFTFITLDGLYLIAIGNNGGDTWTAEQVTLVDQDSLDLPTEYTEDEITTIYNNIT